MAETIIVHENPSDLLSNNKNDSVENTSNTSQLKNESTSISNENFELSKTPNQIQTNHSTYNKTSNNTNNTKSKLSIHNTQSTNNMNFNRFPSDSNYLSHNQTSLTPCLNSNMNQPEIQAQLVAFTPPLMSIRLPNHELQTRHRNSYQPRIYTPNQSNEHLSLPSKSKSETTISQPEYYVDSFSSNFSDKSSSNSSNKTKTKHVTFQEPEILKPSKTNVQNVNLSQSSSNNSNYPSYTWTSRNHMYPTSRSFHHYNYPPYHYPSNPVYSQHPGMMMDSRFMDRPRRMNMIPTTAVWTPHSHYPDHQPQYGRQIFQPKQLYDPNKPKASSTSESHDSSTIIRSIMPKNKKKTKQTNHDDNSNVSTSESISHPITILRKPSTDTGNITLITSNIPQPVEDRPVISSEEKPAITLSSQNRSDIPTENEQSVGHQLDVPNENEQSVEHQLDVPNENEPSIEQPSNVLTENEPSTEQLSDVQSEEKQIITLPIVNQPITQTELNTTISFPIHELLSVLQSANCISSLNEYAQQKKFTLNYEYSSISPSSFTCTVSINNRQFPTSPSCSSKTEAQKLACDQALRILYHESCTNEQSSTEFSTKHDYIAHHSISKFQDLDVNDSLLGRKTLACILMVIDGQFEQARVISIGTGNSCLNETNLIYADDGTCLHDCHAEILARRGLIKYLFEQIKQSKDNKPSIFEHNLTTKKYQLHENITFHMYISSLPCGNAFLNISSNSIRYKQGQTEGTVLPSINLTKYPIKSCSDKICRWNILGIQGGLLINFLTKPIYLETITLACETTFDRNYVKYTLCERLNNQLQSLPLPYILNLPVIDCPKMKLFQQERQVAKLQTNAFAWNITQLNRTELLEPIIGKLKNDRSISSLSKQNFFQDFTNFIQINYPNDDSFLYTTYQQAKQLNKTYVTVKNLISTAFQMASSDSNIPWLSKSDQLEQFSIQ